MSNVRNSPVQLGQRARCGDHAGEVVTLCQSGARIRCDDGRVRFTLRPVPIGGDA